MKKFRHLYLIVVAILMCASVSIPLLFNLAPSRNDADYFYTILDSGMFTQEVSVGGSVHTLNCYRIKNHDTYVAVAWGESVSSAPQTMTIPETITSDKPTGSNVDYTVVAVARAGFSRCTSKTITLPQSVKDIREEAFAYCQNLATFIIPKDVVQISPSTFLDCRSLTNVYYSNDEGRKTMYNSKITTFGDHAFDSCVSLKKIQCPSSATFFGQSCFQKCTTLSVFRFPVDNGLTGDNRNIITIEDYAFADCMSLQRVYFDVNMQHISDYAFADAKNDLTFYFYDTQANFPNSLSSLWRNKKITFGSETVEGVTIDYATTVYDIQYNIEKPVEGNFPGLTVSLSNAERKLDNARTNTTGVTIVPGGSQYAIISRFNTPDEEDWDPDYYDNGKLTIPNEVIVNNVAYPVKVIGPNAFENNDDITEVHFNPQLVQICNKAFWHSNNIAHLDFTECEDLKEISYSIFNDIITKAGKEEDAINTDINASSTKAAENCNYALESLTLPNCLEYLGNFAFYNFMRLTKGLSFKTVPSQPSHLKIIGDYAFAVYSTSSDNNTYLGDIPAEMDIELPNSLDDSYAPIANIYHSFSWDRKGGGSTTYATVNASIWNRVAINKNVFENQDGVRTVTMEKGGTVHDISFASNVFVRNTGIIRFEASANLCMIGTECFKTCSNLREVFLIADRATGNNHGCNSSGVLNNTDVSDPWGVGDGTNSYSQNVFHTDSFHDIVIYVKRTGSGIFPNTTSGKSWHNISTTTNNADHYAATELGNGKRASLPVYTVDWTVDGNVKYWHINDAGNGHTAHNEMVSLSDGPRTTAEYTNGYISFAKESNGNYAVTRYFTDGNNGNYAKTIDLTSSLLSGMTIDLIGHEAFGGKNTKGLYFVLPTTVTTIQERAFFRSTTSGGVRIVTFKNSGGTIQTYTGSTQTFDQIVAHINSQNNDNNRIGYCCLPNTLTRIERVAFYNNFFGSVELGVATSFIGNSCFYSNNGKAKNQSFLFTDYNDATTTDTNSKFEIVNNGIYHKNKKILLAQANGLSGEMVVKSGTKYIGYRAAAGSKYTGVTFDSATTHIYGQAFKNCAQLTTLTNIGSIESIASSESYPTANNDYDRDDGVSGGNDSSAFEGCTNLKVDFSQMPNLRKVGSSSFKNCTNLVNSLGSSKTYDIYSYAVGGSETLVVSNPNKVLDLSLLKKLTNVDGNVFENVSITYAITPNTTDTNYNTASKVTYKADVFKGTNAKVLCGETAQQADQGGNSAYSPTSHYPVGCLGSYTDLYYRFHSSSDILGETAGSTRRYWTAIKTGDADQIKVILFESKEAALDWLDDATNVNRQCHTFPES